MFQSIIFAGVGGFIGTVLRFLCNQFFSERNTGIFPWSTLLVNLAGCFLFGLIIGWLNKNNLLNSQYYIFAITGFCGGLTTFSTFSFELLKLSDIGNWIIFCIYLFISIIGGLLSVFLGKLITQ